MNTIWIVEDHAAFRRTLVRVLNAETDLQCPATSIPAKKLSPHSRAMTCPI
jgi:hypothetical protein